MSPTDPQLCGWQRGWSRDYKHIYNLWPKEAERRQRQAEGRWRTTRLTACAQAHRCRGADQGPRPPSDRQASALPNPDLWLHYQQPAPRCLNPIHGQLRSPTFQLTFLSQNFPKQFFFSNPRQDQGLPQWTADNDFIPFDGIRLTCFRPLSEETVRDLIVKSPTTSCALDLIPTGLLKACIDSLVLFITRIVNDSWISPCVMFSSWALLFLFCKSQTLTLTSSETTDLCLISHLLKKLLKKLC